MNWPSMEPDSGSQQVFELSQKLSPITNVDATNSSTTPQPYEHNSDGDAPFESTTTTKASPVQPSRWKWVQYTRFFWRNIGLGILTFFSSGKGEPPKVLIQSSRWVALSRCAVHLLPAAVSISLVGLNLAGFFIGHNLDGRGSAGDDFKQSTLQVAAKLQELLIVASATSIIFHVLRKELTTGDGLPLGLLVSGWSFASISYFWSPEFWGGVQCSKLVTRRQRVKRYSIASLVFAGGLLALLAGPAAAVLMIPRIVTEQFGGGIFWLNGSEADLYPELLNSEYHADFDCSNDTLKFTDKRCPSSGLLPLFHHFDAGWADINRPITYELRDPHLRKSVFAVPSENDDTSTWAYTAHAATSTMQDAMRSLHTGGLHHLAGNWPLKSPRPRALTWSEDIHFETATRSPMVRALCDHQGVWDLNGDNLPLRFVNFSAWDDHWKNGGSVPEDGSAPATVEIEVRDRVIEHLTSRGVIRDEASPFHDETFGGSSSTLAIPVDTWEETSSSYAIVWITGQTWDPAINGISMIPSNVVVCTVDAGWAESRVFMDHTVHNQLAHDFGTGRVRNIVNTEPAFDTSGMGVTPWTPPRNDSFRRIHIEPSWHDMLSPIVPSSLPEGIKWLPPAETNRTSIETLFSSFFVPTRTETKNIELLVANFVADGLSRCGLSHNHNASRFLDAWGFETGWGVNDEALARTMVRKGDPKESFPEPELLRGGNSTRFEMKTIYGGWMMHASSWFDYLCIVTLLAHAAVALVHSVMIISTGGTSGALDSALEMIALAQVSDPPHHPVLSNTSAGIQSWRTPKVMAWVEASEGGNETGQELQLKMRGALEKRDSALKPVADLAYGSALNEGGVMYRRAKTMV